MVQHREAWVKREDKVQEIERERGIQLERLRDNNKQRVRELQWLSEGLQCSCRLLTSFGLRGQKVALYSLIAEITGWNKRVKEIRPVRRGVPVDNFLSHQKYLKV